MEDKVTVVMEREGKKGNRMDSDSKFPLQAPAINRTRTFAVTDGKVFSLPPSIYKPNFFL